MRMTTRKRQSNYRLVLLTAVSSVPLTAFLAATQARAQEGILDAMSNESLNEARVKQAQSSDYTFKSGDFRMLVTPALSMQWNDNINCTETGKEVDFIILPTVGVAMTYPLTTLNLLTFNITAGYDRYLLHPHLSSLYLGSGSSLAFDVSIKDIQIDLHDQFSYSQDASQNPDVAGTGSFGTFQNTAGFLTDWSVVRNVDFTVGYDHENTETTTASFNDTDGSTEVADSKIGYKWNTKLTTGVEGTASYTHYDQAVLGNDTSYSGGVYADWHPDNFLEVEPRVGYSINQFQQTSALETPSLDSWYADLTVTHQITKFFSYSLTAGHNVSPGVESSASEYWSANLGVSWNFIRNFTLQPQVNFEHGTQGAGTTVLPPGLTNPNLLPSGGETFTWYGGSLGLNYDITRRFTVGVNYQFTLRTSSLSTGGYTQNVIGVQITYHVI